MTCWCGQPATVRVVWQQQGQQHAERVCERHVAAELDSLAGRGYVVASEAA